MQYHLIQISDKQREVLQNAIKRSTDPQVKALLKALRSIPNDPRRPGEIRDFAVSAA